MPSRPAPDPHLAPAEVAIDRLVDRVREIDSAEDQRGYLLLALGILAGNAPDLLHFLIDRADERFVST